ncbi:MAG: hypothetical protein L0Z71_01070 [Anaerolineae bacterium]|nr:hypothetical protein [Anaerolineae bacterium]
MKATLRIISLLLFIVGIIWIIADPGFDALTAFITGILTLLASFLVDKKGKGATTLSPSNQTTILGDVDGNIVIGDQNVIQNTKNIAISLNYIGGLLGASQELMQKVANLIEGMEAKDAENPINITNENFLGDLQSILKSIETEAQHAETVEVMSDLSNILKPIIEKYKVYDREFKFPYADFCKDFVNALASSRNIGNAFTTQPMKTAVFSGGLGDHGRIGIHLRILSKLLPFSPIHAGYYLSVNSDTWDEPETITKIWLCALGWDEWGKKPRKTKKGADGSQYVNGTLDRLQFSGRQIMTENIYRRDADLKYPYFLDLDQQKFSAFIIGLASDFILISSGTIQHDKNFNEKMKKLFNKIDSAW